MITEAELLYPETAVAIAVLETGHFSSRHMMKTHNWFGFRKNRRSFQLWTSKGYGVYATPQLMMRDYQAWEWEICTKYNLSSESAFRNWINKHYAEDPKYPQKLATALSEVSRTWQ